MHSYVLALPVISFFLYGVNAFDDLTRRDLALDTCAEVDADLKIANSLGMSTAIGPIEACICISALPLFIESDIVANAAVSEFGQEKVIAAITDLITGAPDSQHCTYPPHSSPVCTAGNPCFFTCQNGFTPSPPGSFPTDCVCTNLNTCNGVYGYFSAIARRATDSGIAKRATASGLAKRATASGLARRATASGLARRAAASGLAKRATASGLAKRAAGIWARDSCQSGTTCPVPGRGRSAWECVDTMTDLESCGGCIYPGMDGLTGVDCTAIEGVADVACLGGRCIVHRCMPGYKVRTRGSESRCVSDERSVDAMDVLAAEFGLDLVL